MPDSALSVLLTLTALLAVAAGAEELYPLGPDSQRTDAPRGTLTRHTWTSRLFPGTVRDYWLYVPARYTPEKPACLMVFQDGGGFVDEGGRYRVPVVFDNLIAKGDMPVTIGLFVNPGALPPPAEGLPGRPNRSFEYDALSDRYARFLIEELLPEVGRQYRLSDDPSDRAICGSSSGGICAFTAAWQRPDAFRRVLSFVGSFSNLRGGDAYPSLVRKSEPRPLRVFLQSGKRDMNTYAGSWYVQNQALAAALEYLGYDYQVVLGEEGHNGLHGSSILPEALRWLWRGWPQPIRAARPPAGREWATDLVEPDRPWEPCGEGLTEVTCVAGDGEGGLYVAAEGGKRVLRLDATGRQVEVAQSAAAVTELACGRQGRLVGCAGGRLVARGPDGRLAEVGEGLAAAGVAVDSRGRLYVSSPGGRRLSLAEADGRTRTVCEDETPAGRLCLLPGGSLLAVSDPAGRWVWSLRVEPDGGLSNAEAFYRLEAADETSATGAAGMAADEQGYLYVATAPGIQVGDLEGRTALIIANPPGGPAGSLAFGGPERMVLYAAAGGRLYRRPVLRRGAAQ